MLEASMGKVFWRNGRRKEQGTHFLRKIVAPSRFELLSRDPESPMIDRYTTGLIKQCEVLKCLFIFFEAVEPF